VGRPGSGISRGEGAGGACAIQNAARHTYVFLVWGGGGGGKVGVVGFLRGGVGKKPQRNQERPRSTEKTKKKHQLIKQLTRGTMDGYKRGEERHRNRDLVGNGECVSLCVNLWG